MGWIPCKRIKSGKCNEGVLSAGHSLIRSLIESLVAVTLSPHLTMFISTKLLGAILALCYLAEILPPSFAAPLPDGYSLTELLRRAPTCTEKCKSLFPTKTDRRQQICIDACKGRPSKPLPPPQKQKTVKTYPPHVLECRWQCVMSNPTPGERRKRCLKACEGAKPPPSPESGSLLTGTGAGAGTGTGTASAPQSAPPPPEVPTSGVKTRRGNCLNR
jgi:hypothetical protein